MHQKFNAFLLLMLAGTGFFIATLTPGVAASPSPVKFGIRLWNYNTTHVVPNADISLLNKTIVHDSGSTNQTGWVNLTAPNPGTFTLQVKLQNIMVYNASLTLPLTNNFLNLTGVNRANITDYSFLLADRLFRHVQNVEIDLRVNSSLITSAVSAANGTAVVSNIPFHSYNITTSREGVFITNRTIAVNATTYNRNTVIIVPTYNYTLTVKDYMGANPVTTGTVAVYDLGVPSNNATSPLSAQVTIWNLWLGKYVVVVASSNATIWQASLTLASNTTQVINAKIGYTITLHLFDSLNHPISSVTVNLVQNGIIIKSKPTDSNGIVTFSNLPESVFQLNFTLLQRSYATSANITGRPMDLNFKLDDVIILAGSPFNTAPLAASAAPILTVIAALGTVILYRRRRGATESSTAKAKESG